jgi:hypothetical protein
MLAGFGELTGRRRLEGRGRGLDPGWDVLVALSLVLARLDQALQLVGVLGKPGLQALTRFVLLDQLAEPVNVSETPGRVDY